MKITATLDNIARLIACLGLFFIPYSPTLSSLIFIAALLAFFSGNLLAKLRHIFAYKMSYCAVALLIIFALGITQNKFGWQAGLFGWYKNFVHLFSLLLLIPLFSSITWRRYAANVILLSATLYLLLYNYSALLLHDYTAHKPLYNMIYLAYAAFLLLHRLYDEKEKKLQICYILLLFGFAFTILLFNSERTGQCVFLALIILFCYQRFHWQGIVVGLVLCLTSVTILFYASPIFHKRAMEIAYAFTQPKTSSSQLRLEYWKKSLPLIAERPLTGHGTGLFSTGSNKPELQKYNAAELLEKNILNPENSYLQIALQVGVPGLTIFLLLLALQFIATQKLTVLDRYYAQGSIVLLMVSSCTIVAFYLSPTSLLYAATLGIFLGGLDRTQTTPTLLN